MAKYPKLCQGIDFPDNKIMFPGLRYVLVKVVDVYFFRRLESFSLLSRFLHILYLLLLNEVWAYFLEYCMKSFVICRLLQNTCSRCSPQCFDQIYLLVNIRNFLGEKQLYKLVKF